MTGVGRFKPSTDSTFRCIACFVLLALFSHRVSGQAKAPRRVLDFDGFTAAGETARAVDLSGFVAAGAPPRAAVDLAGFTAAGVTLRLAVELPAFAATGVAPRTFNLPAFSATGVTADSSTQTAASTLPAASGQPVAGTVPASRPAVTDSAPPMVRGCTGGCFAANGTSEEQLISLRGPAVVNVDDGSRFELILGTHDMGTSYVSFARDPGGPPRPGTYALADRCSEQPKEAARDTFVAEFVTRAYAEDAASFVSAGGSLVIERVVKDRFSGSFSFVACRFDADGKRHDVRMRGTFDAAK